MGRNVYYCSCFYTEPSPESRQ